eukprot:CAMPEP_0115536160 /NCGR_PEP_ID=MMETSP0271-20121206/87627_1 /TAXON_ID=71861 /ORGANISM="Scrippsiella trochoidea, Strain CCMP3099" /LENGTH=677 /DNA_ID=CAMNT_0002968831 /DNA_START=20 /DNA_END=2050 /DNA_ORIENTATION=-
MSALDADELWTLLLAYRGKHGGASASANAASSSRQVASAAPSSAAGSGEDWRFNLVRSVGEECQTEEELRKLLQRKSEFILYDGFEPSGRMHIAQGVFKALNVNKCTKAGGVFIFWVADWFALMNDKMGGDLEKIKVVGQYFIEVWKATGMDMSRVRFRWSSDDIINSAKEYWGQALDIARNSTIARVKRCGQIMGRKSDSLSAAQIMYPIMQSTDIFFLKADICQLGVDQRKVNMLARDYCDSVGRSQAKPIILSHHMLYGLAAGQAKMSKSNPDSAVFMEDSPADVERKIRNAYCPTKPEEKAAKAGEDEEMSLVKDDLMNPCLDYVQHILFSQDGYVFKANGKTYSSHEDVRAAFLSGEISEKSLKDRLIEEINTLLDPVRKHFKENETARDCLSKITEWKKENLVAPKVLTRLHISPPLPDKVFVVFAPLPSESLQLEVVFGVVHRLKQAPCAFYDLLIFGVKSLAPELMQSLRICWQGEMILTGPSEYWISVINAGRLFDLGDISSALPYGETLVYASQVFATLMHVADVLAFSGCSHITLCCDMYHKRMHHLALRMYDYHDLVLHELKLIESPKLRLLEDGEGAVADVNVMLTDKEIDVNKKIKKSFCMPQNIAFCPPVTWVSELLKFQREFVVQRKPDNGGDKSYSDVEALREDFASGALHPGDLKPALG